MDSVVKEMVSVRQLARSWHISKDRVLDWIRAGLLPAINLTTNGGRPRYRIDPAEIERHMQRLAAVPAPITTQRGKPHKDLNGGEYY